MAKDEDLEIKLKFDFSKRRILVTGAAGGLGCELVRKLVDSGAEVVAIDLDEAKGSRLADAVGSQHRGSFTYIALDQSSVEAVDDSLRRELDANGPVDSVVNNAAIYPTTSASDVTQEEFNRVHAVNVGGAVAIVRACLPGMRQKRFGRIINIASITFDLGFADLASYVASKGALIGLSRTWAREFGGDGITANAISPGAFQTDAEKIHPNPEAYSQFVMDQQAIKRRGVPADFAALVAFLLSEEAGFITGQTIRVDGGWVMA